VQKRLILINYIDQSVENWLKELCENADLKKKLPPQSRTYFYQKMWKGIEMKPRCLIYFVGCGATKGYQRLGFMWLVLTK